MKTSLKATTPSRGKKKKKEPDIGPDQRRIKEFFSSQPRQTLATQETPTPGEPGNTNINKGTTNGSPLLGASGCWAPKSPSNGGPEPKTEVRGGLRVAAGKKRSKILEMWEAM